MGDVTHDKVLPVLVHGDAAFAGQGVVAETLNLSMLKGYSTGGTIHLVINNQIGFTATPERERSSTYCTDVARMVQAPILHCNGDDPEACVRAIQIAFDYRQQYKKDVVNRLVCYASTATTRADDPSYTQPLMYRKIKEQKPVGELYTGRLLREGVISSDWAERVRKQTTIPSTPLTKRPREKARSGNCRRSPSTKRWLWISPARARRSSRRWLRRSSPD